MANKTRKMDKELEFLAPKVACIARKSVSLVKKVIRDERRNDHILDTYMELKETIDEKENELLRAVKELVPFK